MIDWGQFHFLRPAWFLLLVPLAALTWYLARHRAGSRSWEAVCDPALLPHVLVATPGRVERRAIWPVVLAGLLATVALAGPAWKHLPVPVFSSTQALVIVLDLSRSMNATDLAPTRMERARFKIADLLRLRRDGQTALVVYAGEAFTVAPLTDDAGTLLAQLPALAPAIMPVPGNRADTALSLAQDLLVQAGLARGDVLLVTDEVNGDDAVSAATALQGAGYRVSVLGVGTEQGAPIPLADGSFLEDENGQIVIAALDESPLRELARAGGGIYRPIAVDDGDLQALVALLDQRPARDETRTTELQADAWRDEGAWLVLALLPLAALGFRRGLVLAVVLLALPVPRPAQAMEWRDLWLRPDQQGVRALEQGDARRAAELLADPRWQGAARYRAGEYEAAAGALESAPDPDSLYNRGNALARMGRYPEALAAYDAVLKLQPGHGDAKFNRDVVQKEMQQQQQQAPQQGNDGQQGDQQQQSGEGQQSRGESEQGEQPGRDPSEGEQAQGGQSDSEPGQQQGAEAGARDGTDNDGAVSAEPRAAQDGTPAAEEMQEESTQSGDAVESPGEPDAAPMAEAGAREAPATEDQQALEQWLRRIPDDPGGLLRRKFQYQYQMRRAGSDARPSGGKTW